MSDPTKMTCEEYVAVEREVQPQVAKWLQGYTEGAESQKSNTAGAGADAASVQPAIVEVTWVVEECREAPKKSLWDKIKEKFRRS